jgi:hypothetical protein
MFSNDSSPEAWSRFAQVCKPAGKAGALLPLFLKSRARESLSASALGSGSKLFSVPPG